MNLRNVYRRIISKLILSAINTEGLAKALGLESTDLIVQKLSAITKTHESEKILDSVLSPLMIELGRKHKALVGHKDFDMKMGEFIKWFKDNIKTQEGGLKQLKDILKKHNKNLSVFIIEEFLKQHNEKNLLNTITNELSKGFEIKEDDRNVIDKEVLKFKEKLVTKFPVFSKILENIFKNLMSISDLSERTSVYKEYEKDNHLEGALSEFKQTLVDVTDALVQEEYKENDTFRDATMNIIKPDYSIIFSQLENYIDEDSELLFVYNKIINIKKSILKESLKINNLKELHSFIQDLVQKYSLTSSIEHRFKDKQHDETGKKVDAGDVISRIGVGSDIVKKYGLKESNKVLDKNGNPLVQEGNGKLIILLQEHVNLNCNVISGFINAGSQYCVLQKGSLLFDHSVYPSPYCVVFLETVNGDEFVRRIVGVVIPALLFDRAEDTFTNITNDGVMDADLKNIIMSDERVLNFINSNFNQSNGKYYQKTKENFNLKEGDHNKWIDLFASKYENGLCNETRNLTDEQIIYMIENGNLSLYNLPERIKEKINKDTWIRVISDSQNAIKNPQLLEVIPEDVKNDIGKNVWIRWVNMENLVENKMQILNNMPKDMIMTTGRHLAIGLVNEAKNIQEKLQNIRNINKNLGTAIGKDYWITLVKSVDYIKDKKIILKKIPEDILNGIDTHVWLKWVDEFKNDKDVDILSIVPKDIKEKFGQTVWIELLREATSIGEKIIILNSVPEVFFIDIVQKYVIDIVNNAKDIAEKKIIFTHISSDIINNIDTHVWIECLSSVEDVEERLNLFNFIPRGFKNNIDTHIWIEWINSAKNVEEKSQLLRFIPESVGNKIDPNVWIELINSAENVKEKSQLLIFIPESVGNKIDTHIWIEWINSAKNVEEKKVTLSNMLTSFKGDFGIDFWTRLIKNIKDLNEKLYILALVSSYGNKLVDDNLWIELIKSTTSIKEKTNILRHMPTTAKSAIDIDVLISLVDNSNENDEKKQILTIMPISVKNKIKKDVWKRWIAKSENDDYKLFLLETVPTKIKDSIEENFWNALLTKTTDIKGKMQIVSFMPEPFKKTVYVRIVNKVKNIKDKLYILERMPADIANDIDENFWNDLLKNTTDIKDKMQIVSFMPKYVKNNINKDIWINLINAAKTSEDKDYFLYNMPEGVKSTIDNDTWIRWVKEAKEGSDYLYTLYRNIPQEILNSINNNDGNLIQPGVKTSSVFSRVANRVYLKMINPR